MNTRARWLVTKVAILALALPMAAAAQDGGWTFRGTSEFGAFVTTRDLAKNVGGIQEVVALQVSAKLNNAPSWGAGVEVWTPDQRTAFRGVVRGTLNGTAAARVTLCAAFDNVGELCFPREADVRLTSFHGEVVFVQGTPDDAFRQNFILGGGLRSYQFTVESCDPGASTNPDVFVICELVQEIYENQAQVQPFIQFGFGFSYDVGPITFSTRVNDIVGPYRGGSGNADGDFQNDVYFTAGASFRVR